MMSFVDSFQKGVAQGEESRRKRTLRDSFLPAVQGDTAALSEIGKVDPNEYMRVQGYVQTQQTQQKADTMAEVLNTSRLLTEAPDDQKANVYKVWKASLEAHPEISKGFVLPEAYEPGALQAAQAFVQAQQGIGGKVFSQKISDDGYLVNTYADGRVEKTSQKADRQAWFRDQPGMDPAIVNKDGSVVTPGATQQPAQTTTQFTGPDGMPIKIGDDVDPALRAQILANPGAFNAVPDGSSATLPPVNRQPGQARGGLQARPLMTPAQEQSMTLAQQAAARADQQLELSRRGQDRADQTASFAREQATSKRAAGKPLPAGTVEKLANDSGKLSNLQELAGGFDDKYAGNMVGGSAENLAGRLGLPGSTPGQSEWWQQYDRYKNEIRNELFGASLTEGEKAAFAAADVDPNMKPSVIRANLKKQADVMSRVLTRKAQTWAAQGYDREAIEAATGAQLGAPPAAPKPPTTARPQSEAEYNALPKGALFIDPDDGKTYRKP